MPPIKRRVPLNGAAFPRRRTRTHDPLAMQKVVGSNPIIRFARNPLQTVRFSCLVSRSWNTPHRAESQHLVSVLRRRGHLVDPQAWRERGPRVLRVANFLERTRCDEPLGETTAYA